MSRQVEIEQLSYQMLVFCTFLAGYVRTPVNRSIVFCAPFRLTTRFAGSGLHCRSCDAEYEAVKIINENVGKLRHPLQLDIVLEFARAVH